MLVVDGTVMLAWAVQAPFSAQAADLLADGAELAAPQAALGEALEGARRLAALGHLEEDDLKRLPGLLMPLLSVLAADAPLMTPATELAARHGLPLAAALALALASARKAELATADARLAEAARQVAGVERVRLLGPGPDKSVAPGCNANDGI